jgi:hypothetical protein
VARLLPALRVAREGRCHWRQDAGPRARAGRSARRAQWGGGRQLPRHGEAPRPQRAAAGRLRETGRAESPCRDTSSIMTSTHRTRAIAWAPRLRLCSLRSTRVASPSSRRMGTGNGLAVSVLSMLAAEAWRWTGSTSSPRTACATTQTNYHPISIFWSTLPS